MRLFLRIGRQPFFNTDRDIREIKSRDLDTIPVDTGRKLNVHKTFRRRPGRLLNVLCTFNLRPVSTGFEVFILMWQVLFKLYIAYYRKLGTNTTSPSMSSLEKLHSVPLSKSFISIFRILYFNYESLKYVLEGLMRYKNNNNSDNFIAKRTFELHKRSL